MDNDTVTECDADYEAVRSTMAIGRALSSGELLDAATSTVVAVGWLQEGHVPSRVVK
jgi:hypothetical protein